MITQRVLQLWERIVTESWVDEWNGDAGCVARLFATCRRLYWNPCLTLERRLIRYAWGAHLAVQDTNIDRQILRRSVSRSWWIFWTQSRPMRKGTGPIDVTQWSQRARGQVGPAVPSEEELEAMAPLSEGRERFLR